MNSILKKYLKVFVISGLVIDCMPITNAFADEGDVYINTVECDAAEEYAVDNIQDYMIGNGDTVDGTDYFISDGILINDPEDYTKYLFPVWHDDEIIGSFIVIDIDGELTGTYSHLYVDKLNEIIYSTSENEPLSIVVDDEMIYGVIGDDWYDLLCCESEAVNNGYYANEELDTVLIDNTIDIIMNPIPRIPTSYAKSFTRKYIQTAGYCYSYAMGTILWNMGYSSYTPVNIQSFTGYASSASPETMSNYLSSKGLSCSFSNTGYMGYSSVANRIYNYGNYIYIGASNTSNNNGHALVIYGYTDNGTNQLYRVWNPWYDYTQTFNSSTRIITTASSTTYRWDRGYVYNIH